MKMKKYVFGFALMMGATLLTGCLGDDSTNNEGQPIVVTQGALVINNGNENSGIDGSLTYLDFATGLSQQNVYKKANNNRSLGITPNDVIVYGQKVYITGFEENTIFILNAKTFEEIDKVSTTELLGDEGGYGPRRLAAYGNKVYFTTYGGYVAGIDTLNFKTTPSSTFKVDHYPEGLIIKESSDGKTAILYVANSDWGMGGGYISKINLSTGTILPRISHELISNPQSILVGGDVLYVLDWGYYDANDNYTQKGAGVYRIDGDDVKLVVEDATGMAGANYSIITYNDPYNNQNGPSFSVYDVRTERCTPLTLRGDTEHPIVSPSAIAIDPYWGYILIASRTKDQETGFVNSALPGFVNRYDNSGNYIDWFNAGVEPYKIEFTYGTTTLN